MWLWPKKCGCHPVSQKLASGRHMTASSGQSEWWIFCTCVFSTQIRIFKVSFVSPVFRLFSSCYSKRQAGVIDVTFSLDFLSRYFPLEYRLLFHSGFDFMSSSIISSSEIPLSRNPHTQNVLLHIIG